MQRISHIEHFDSYLDDLVEKMKKKIMTGKKVNPVHEIVSTYLAIRGWDTLTKEEFKAKKISYPRLCKEAKTLYTACGNKLEDSLWSLDRMNYKAHKGRFEWTISTCMKHKLNE